MTSFSVLLDRLDEARDGRPFSRLIAGHEWAMIACAGQSGVQRDLASADMRTKDAIARYLCVLVGSETPTPKAPVDPPRASSVDDLLAQLDSTVGSMAELQGLRRKLAWLCHPDRLTTDAGRAGGVSMAEINARIDRAIRHGSNRRTDSHKDLDR